MLTPKLLNFQNKEEYIFITQSEFLKPFQEANLAHKFYDETGKSSEVYYCVTSFYKNYPPTHIKESDIDKYYTKTTVVDQCIDIIKDKLNISKDDLIIEPSAGNGAFINKIKTLSNNYKFYDIEPENAEITKQDFLLLDYNQFKNNYPKIHVIGNPPFGRQASLAIKFIKTCCEFATTISFILPKSFKKESNKAKFDLFYHLVCDAK